MISVAIAQAGDDAVAAAALLGDAVAAEREEEQGVPRPPLRGMGTHLRHHPRQGPLRPEGPLLPRQHRAADRKIHRCAACSLMLAEGIACTFLSCHATILPAHWLVFEVPGATMHARLALQCSWCKYRSARPAPCSGRVSAWTKGRDIKSKICLPGSV